MYVDAFNLDSELDNTSLDDVHLVDPVFFLKEHGAFVEGVLVEVEHDLMEYVDVQVLHVLNLLQVSLQEYLDVVIVRVYLLLHLLEQAGVAHQDELEVGRTEFGEGAVVAGGDSGCPLTVVYQSEFLFRKMIYR